MTRADELRLQASLLMDGATIPPERGRYMADKLVAFARQDEEAGFEFRQRAQQLADSIDTLTGCTPEQRFELRKLADFLSRYGDHLAPAGSLFDPDEVVEEPAAQVLQFRRVPRFRMASIGTEARQ